MTEGESLFENYLSSNGYKDFTFEPDIPCQRKKPDYLLRWHGQEFFFEVKDLHQKSPFPEGGVHIDPYKSLREEINEVRKKFKTFKDWCCSLVVYNISDWEAKLEPRDVFAAMLGNLGWVMDYDRRAGVADPDTMRLAFRDGGKMIGPRTGEPQNTTISSIIVLEWFRVENEEFLHACQKLPPGEKRAVFAAEHWLKYPPSQRFLRVRVNHNPDASNPLPDFIFNGSYDEHWQIQANGVVRVFASDRLRKAEFLENEPM